MSVTAVSETMASNIQVIKLDAPLGAEIRGVDFAHKVGDEARQVLLEAWTEHLILLFRGQSHLTQEQHSAATEVFGTPVPGASRSYFEDAGVASNLLSSHPEIIMVTNMGPDGQPTAENASLGSGEVVWHSDNSYIAEPPIGSFLRALLLPETGGNTSFSNQYLAFDTLPGDIKARIEGLYTRQDASRNSAGRLRPGVKAPKTLADVPGPDHPLVRIHPASGRKALYLGRRRDFPSQYVVGWERDESEDLLDFLWAHATRDELAYTHVWELGDMILWDNRCVMHRRDPLDPTQLRIMHRTQMERQKPVPA
jgi:taurine dioxygenase